MKIRSTLKPHLSIESVALTDIIMNLFIFFFISFSLLYTFNPLKESKIKLNLPKGVSENDMRLDRSFIVSIDSKNRIFIAGSPIRESALKGELAKHAKTAGKNGIVVKADRQASVDYLIRVLDTAQQAGISKVGVSMEIENRIK